MSQLKTKPASVCPIANAARLLGDRWTLVILRDLADAGNRGAISNPFASTSQYSDVLGDRAQTPKLYGGGCIDLGSPGGYTCQLGNTTGSGNGNPYPVGDPTEDCSPSIAGDVCITNAAIQHEVSTMLSSTGVDTLHARTGNTPLVVMMLPAFCAIMCGETWRTISQGPRTLIAITLSQVATSHSS